MPSVAGLYFLHTPYSLSLFLSLVDSPGKLEVYMLLDLGDWENLPRIGYILNNSCAYRQFISTHTQQKSVLEICWFSRRA